VLAFRLQVRGPAKRSDEKGRSQSQDKTRSAAGEPSAGGASGAHGAGERGMQYGGWATNKDGGLVLLSS